jgi:Zn-dependent peptidase ImmA (M78 family)/DNA-binding XRE family transcriptional regulator
MGKGIDLIDPKLLGERLRVAREGGGITQAQAAGAVDLSRTTLLAIEKGQRKARLKEIQELAKLYGTTANTLLRNEAVCVDISPRFRKITADDDVATAEAARVLSSLVKAEVELENLLGVVRPRNDPPERKLLPGDVRLQAEQDAQDLRNRLGLGISPIPDIISLLEMELGMRVYLRRLDGRISGLFAYDPLAGPCMLLNANHPPSRRNQSAAHECGHYISARNEPEILLTDEHHQSRSEKYANVFGRALMTPSRGVMQKFQEVTAGSDRFTRRHVIVLAHFFSVSREAIVRRLEELDLVKQGTWEWFQNQGGITDEQASQVLGIERYGNQLASDADQPVSLRMGLLVNHVYQQGLLSEGQLSNLLDIDRIELREVLDDQEEERSEPDVGFELP